MEGWTLSSPILFKGNRTYYPPRDELLEQLPSLKKKFVSYSSYANAGITDILDDAQRKRARTLKVESLTTTVFINNGSGKFESRERCRSKHNSQRQMGS